MEKMYGVFGLFLLSKVDPSTPCCKQSTHVGA